ncbi:hypothetical protein MKW92_029045 [Papaver armeniacum]|nr:hypothetical protein MKW92_029045 [Papaver armeniacum]
MGRLPRKTSPLPRKTNQNLDFRSTKDNAWYTVGKMILNKTKNILTVRFAEFGKEDDEKFNVKDFNTVEELDNFLNRFRPACLQLQDQECADVSRGLKVCAMFDQGDEDQKFYDGVIESIDRKRHKRRGGAESCACAFVVGWLEGPGENSIQQMGIERICRVQPGSPLFDQALAYFMKVSREQLDMFGSFYFVSSKAKKMVRLPKKTNQKLDFRSTKDDAWYTVAKLSLENNILVVSFEGFDKEDNEKFSTKGFKTFKEQDEECPDLSSGYEVCALLDQGEDKKFYNGIIESIRFKHHRRKGGKKTCSCAFEVGWSEGPKAGSTQHMGIEGICKIVHGSPLFHRALDCFMKTSSKQLDLVSNDNQMLVKKRSR